MVKVRKHSSKQLSTTTTSKNEVDIILKGGRSGSVEECLTGDRGAAGSNLTSVTALCP